MADAVPTSVADLVAAEQSQLNELDARIKATSKMQKPGDGGKLLPTLNAMRGRRTDIYDETTKAILASADLAAALSALNTATQKMQTVAANMTDVNGVLSNGAKYLGYAGDALTAVKSVTGSA